MDDKHSKVICARRNKVSEVFKHEIRKEYEIAHVDIEEKEQVRKVCERPRYFNYEKQVCECPKNKVSLASSLASFAPLPLCTFPFPLFAFHVSHLGLLPFLLVIL